MQRAVIIVFVS